MKNKVNFITHSASYSYGNNEIILLHWIKNRCLFVYSVNLLAKKTATGPSLLKTGLQQKVKACFLIGLMVNLWQHIKRPFPISICQYIWGNVSKCEQNKKSCFLNAMWRMWRMYNSPYLSMRHRCLYQSGKHIFNQCWKDPWKKAMTLGFCCRVDSLPQPLSYLGHRW